MKRALVAAGVVILALAGPSGPAHAAETRIWDREFSVGSRPSVHIRTDDARVTVRSWKDSRVQVHVERKGSTHGLVLGRPRPLVDIGQRGNEIDVTVRMHGQNGVLFDTAHFEVEIWLPRSCDVMVDSQDGPVRIDEVVGRVDVETQDGSFTGRSLRGEIAVHSQDGHVDLDDVDGALHVETHDGSSQVRGRFDLVDVSSSDGGIQLDAAPGSRLHEEWSLRSSDGSIRLRIPRALAATIDARTADGGLDVDLPIQVQGSLGEHRIVGDLNGGGPTLRLRCSDGTIRVSAID
jgi:Toastrack DUF4097